MFDSNLVYLLAHLLCDFLWLLDLKGVTVKFPMFLYYLEEFREKLLIFFDGAILLSPSNVHLEYIFEVVGLDLELAFLRSMNLRWDFGFGSGVSITVFHFFIFQIYIP